MTIWYRGGTVTMTNGSPAVAGAGTAWIANVRPGDAMQAPNGTMIEIAAVNSDTSLTLGANYGGATAAGQPYAIIPIPAAQIVSAVGRVNVLIDETQAVVDGAGAGNFEAGSAAAPGIAFTVDQDTGLFLAGSNEIGFSTGGVERMRLTSDGKLAVGNATAQAKLHATGAPSLAVPALGAAPVDIAAGPAGAYGMMAGSLSSGLGYIQQQRWDGNATAYDLLLQPNGGFVGVGVSAAAARLHIAAGDQAVARMRMQNTAASGAVFELVAGIHNLAQTGFSIFDVGAGATRFAIEGSGAIRPGVDNGQNIGTGSYRWSVVYAATGTINTSDAREKTWRGAVARAELRAATRIAREIGVYQWNDAIAEKGPDNARLHVGVRAQAVWAIMAEEGLVVPIGEDGKPGETPYAFLCWDQWSDELTDEMVEFEVPASVNPDTGEEMPAATIARPTGKKVLVRAAGDRFGVRVDQLALFIAAGQEARLAALEAGR